MDEIDFEKRFKKIIPQREINLLESIAIFEGPAKGEYIVFNKYHIKKRNGITDVLNTYGELIHSFSSIKSALCWCIYDKRGKYGQANRILDLDIKVSGYYINFEMHKKLFKKAKDTELKLIYLAKLNEDKIKRRQVESELDSFIEESRKWQEKQYTKTV